jgi:hypothetical protein
MNIFYTDLDRFYCRILAFCDAGLTTLDIILFKLIFYFLFLFYIYDRNLNLNLYTYILEILGFEYTPS